MDEFSKVFMENDKYAKELGVELIKSENGFAECRIKVEDKHKNGLGSLHGGVIFSLGDIAFAAACNRERRSIGLEAEIKYLNKPKGRIIYAKAREISSSNRIGHYNVDIYDDLGTKIALFTSTAYRLKE